MKSSANFFLYRISVIFDAIQFFFPNNLTLPEIGILLGISINLTLRRRFWVVIMGRHPSYGSLILRGGYVRMIRLFWRGGGGSDCWQGLFFRGILFPPTSKDTCGRLWYTSRLKITRNIFTSIASLIINQKLRNYTRRSDGEK